MFFTQEKHMKSASSKESELFDRKLMMNTSKSQDHNEDETINKQNSYNFNKQPLSFSRKFHNIDGNEDEMMDMTSSMNQIFNRKFANLDLTTCWLNSSLQLILNGIDHLEPTETLTSELGQELDNLRSENLVDCLDPTLVKQILTTAEDIRIATRMSELTRDIEDSNVLTKRLQNIEDLRLNLASGQQCVRDFLLCISENSESWPDIHSLFSFNIFHSSTCMICKEKVVSQTNQMYVELDVPANDSSLDIYVEDFFNRTIQIEKFCENCKQIVFAEKQTQLSSVEETKVFIILMRRAIDTPNGYAMNENRIISTNDIVIRYVCPT